nr:50S ribosomal protein L4 [Actinomycetota bacterium]
GVAFPPSPRSFALKMNRKARRAALAGALSAHAARGSLGLVSGEWDAPSTKAAEALVEAWGATRPLVVVADESEESLLKSFRNLERVAVTVPGELGVAEVVWARSLLVTEAALPLVQARVEA